MKRLLCGKREQRLGWVSRPSAQASRWAAVRCDIDRATKVPGRTDFHRVKVRR